MAQFTKSWIFNIGAIRNPIRKKSAAIFRFPDFGGVGGFGGVVVMTCYVDEGALHTGCEEDWMTIRWKVMT